MATSALAWVNERVARQINGRVRSASVALESHTLWPPKRPYNCPLNTGDSNALAHQLMKNRPEYWPLLPPCACRMTSTFIGGMKKASPNVQITVDRNTNGQHAACRAQEHRDLKYGLALQSLELR